MTGQIHWAAKRGDHEAIQRHLRRGAEIDSGDRAGKTPLMYAAEGRLATVATLRLLIEAGADVNARSTMLETTPLCLAASSGDSAKVHCLLDARADAGFVSSKGYTAITNVPVFRDARHLEVLEMLLQAGSDPDVITSYNECPLRIATSRGNFQAVNVLMKHGASREPAQFTDLMWALALGSVDDVAQELQHGGDLAARDRWNMTPWLLSLLVGDVAKAQLLLRRWRPRERSCSLQQGESDVSRLLQPCGDDAMVA